MLAVQGLQTELLETNAGGIHSASYSLAPRPSSNQSNDLTEGCSGGAWGSLGERQLLSFARALQRRPRVLVLDEPHASLDDVAAQRVRQIWSGSGGHVAEWLRRCTVLVISHHPDDLRACDRVGLMSSGQLIDVDQPEILLARLSEAR